MESLKTKLTEKPKKLFTEFAAYWKEISNKEYDFARCEFSFIYSVVVLSLNSKFKFKSWIYRVLVFVQPSLNFELLKNDKVLFKQ